MIKKATIWTLTQLRRLAKEEHAASLIEYALLIALLVLVVIVAVQNFSNAFSDAANYISTEIREAVNS